MPASADKQALTDELSHELRLARIVILDESRCQPTCLRNPPLGCARVPTCIQFEEGRCVVLDSCGGREVSRRR